MTLFFPRKGEEEMQENEKDKSWFKHSVQDTPG